MTECIYPNCNEEVNFGASTIEYCKLGKHLPLFLCPHCKSANRTLAAYCRECGKKISFVESRRKFDSEFRIQNTSSKEKSRPLTEEFYSFDLAVYRITQDNLALPPYPCFGGILLITTNGKGLWFDHYHKELIREFNFSEEIAIPPFHNNRNLFVFTTRSIFSVDLVTFEQEQIFTTETADNLILYVQPIFSKGIEYPYDVKENPQFLTLLYNLAEDQTSLKMICPENGNVLDNATFSGRASYPIKTDKNLLFFYTPSEIIYFDLNRGEIVAQQKNQNEFDIDIPPRVSNSQIYVVGNEKIFRINTQNSSYSPMLVGLPSEVSQIKFQVSGANLIIAHSNGLLITTGLGRPIFSSERIRVDAHCAKFPPVIFGKQIAFSALFPNGEVLYILAEGSYRVVAQRRYENILFKPVVAAGHLFLTVKERGTLNLKVYLL